MNVDMDLFVRHCVDETTKCLNITKEYVLRNIVDKVIHPITSLTRTFL